MKRFLLSLVSIIFVVLIARPADGLISKAWVDCKNYNSSILNDKMTFHSSFIVYGLEGKRCCLEIKIFDSNGKNTFVNSSLKKYS